MAPGEISIPSLLVEPRDTEERFRLSCLAWCLKQLGGEVRLPMEIWEKFLDDTPAIEVTGDTKRNEMVVRLAPANSSPLSIGPKLSPTQKRASNIDIEDK